MLFLQTLGRIRLARADGSEIDELLRQPKRLALLAYLCSPRPGVWHRRDVLLAVFWSSLDTPRARTALRNALYVLRQHLGEGVIRTRGDEEVSVDPALLTSDVATLESAVAAARFDEALARYEGEVLPGLHIADAEGFEGWLDEERARVRRLVSAAGLGLAEARERAGDLAGAAVALAGVVKLDPIDESAIRRLIALHDRSGDRARALDTYERFRARLAGEFEAEPAAETVELADTIRARRVPERVSTAVARNQAATPLRGAPVENGAAATSPMPASGTEVGDGAPERVLERTASPAERGRGGLVRRRVLVAAVAAFSVVGLAAAVTSLARRTSEAVSPRTLIVLPIENRTQRKDLDYLATGLGDEIATRLRGIGGLETTKSPAGADWPAAVRKDLSRIAEAFGAQVAFRGQLSFSSDSVVVTGDVVDVATTRGRAIGRQAFLVDSLRDGASRIAAAIAGTLFRSEDPEMPRRSIRDDIDPESFRLTLRAWHAFTPASDSALAMFMAAVRRDRTNARAWAGLSSVWASRAVTWRMPFDDGAARAEAAVDRALALDSLEGTAWLNRAAIRGHRTRSLVVAESLLARAIAADPGNPEIYAIKSSLYRHAGDWVRARDAARMARQMEPLSPGYIGGEALLGLCGNDPEESLRLYLEQATIDPSAPGPYRGVARARARLGQWEQAVNDLRRGLTDSARGTDTTRSGLSAEEEYWALIHRDGKRRLDQLRARERTGWVSKGQMAFVMVAAGDLDGGLDLLETEARKGDVGAYRAWCNVDMDEARMSPRTSVRLATIMSRLPKWELPEPVPRT